MLFFVLFFSSVLLGYTFSFEPMSVAISDFGTGTITTFKVVNESKERIAIRIRITTREMTEDGKETNKDIPESTFLIYPSRFVVEPESQQSIKVQWRGGTVGEKEQAFRIIAEQVPVNFEKSQGSALTLLFKYVGALYVVPPKASPAAIAVQSVVGASEKGMPGFIVRIQNSGGCHEILVDTRLDIYSEGQKKFVLNTADLAAIEGQNILAGMTRQFFIPYPEAKNGVQYEGRVTYNAER
ncbi:MAG: fimbria/pilus periplasmic chaperone [Treponema sp.]|nr:fimbria/pilus periplasmic chaperone [Treponema sp.]